MGEIGHHWFLLNARNSASTNLVAGVSRHVLVTDLVHSFDLGLYQKTE